MSLLNNIAGGLRGLFRKEEAEQEMDEELRGYLDAFLKEKVAAGMSPAAALREARQEFGSLEAVKENTRAAGWEYFVETIWQDLRFGARILRKSAGFTAVAVLTLALGIGASTVVFSVVYNVFFKAFPYKDYDRSVVLDMRSIGNAGGWIQSSQVRRYFYPEEVRAFREQNHVFENMIAYNVFRPTYSDGKSTRFFFSGAVVTTNTFDYLGVPPLLGRTISREDGNPGAPPVFIMNYRLWQREFGGDPKILGTTFILDGIPTTLVGIMPLQFNAFGANFWLPVNQCQRCLQGGALVMGRLRPGVSVQTARADLDAIAHRAHRVNPSGSFREQTFPEENFAIVPRTLLDSLIGNFKITLYALLAAVLLMLLIACSNVANLSLARATAREKEMAMRSTLGATRGRLVRQLLVESLMLAVTAATAGCALAYFGLKVVVALIPAGTIPEETVIRMNAPVLFFALGVTILTTILCGLAPALHIVCGDLQPRLADSGKGIGRSFRHGKLRAGLVVSEVALSIVLLIGAGILMRSFLVFTRADLGFDPKNILYFVLNLPPTYNTDLAGSLEKKNALTRQLLDRMRALPGVTSVSESINQPPLQNERSDTIIPGKPHTERWETRIESCSEGYFQTLGLLLLRGRLFSEDDVNAARHVVVINETFARQYFPNDDPLGHEVKFALLDAPELKPAAPRDTYFEIVGIVRDYKTRDYDNPSWRSFPQAFYPYSVQGYNWRSFMARTTGGPNSLLKDFGREVRALDPGVQISTSGTLEDSMQEFYRGPQFELVTLTAFAALGLLLVSIGIFSVLAYSVSLRTHEVGVRMALGAQREDILSMVVKKGVSLICAGIIIGSSASFVLTRFLASQTWGVSPTDPLTFAAVVSVVIAVGVAACLLPARRATQVDPMVALRHE